MEPNADRLLASHRWDRRNWDRTWDRRRSPNPWAYIWIGLLSLAMAFAGVRPALAGPAAGSAPASENLRAAIIPLSVEGEIGDADREQLTTELVDGLQRGAFGIVTPDAVRSAVASAAKCDSAGCWKRIAKATKATHVVRARVTLTDRDYDVEVQLVDGRSGAVLATSREGCEICGIVDAGNLVATSAATLRTKLDALSRGPATLKVVSNPSGAEVRIDGEIAGTTPLDSPVVPGKKVLRVSKDGFIAVEREVTIVEGVAEQLSFELEKVPSRLPSRPWGWVSLGVGIAAVGTSVGFAVLDDRPFKVGGACDGPDNQDPDGDCKRLWDTDWITFSTAIAGAALTTLGIAILVDSAKRRRDKKGKKKRNRRKRTARFGVGWGSLIVQGTF